jgi:putative (di)nucleoside polyphosphate hydrolase
MPPEDLALPIPEDVQHAIGKLRSLQSGDIGIIETLSCGKRSIPALRVLLFGREPSGLYQSRCRAVEALAALDAYDVLIDFLSALREIEDPIERTGEEAVINAAARALVKSRDESVFLLLLAFAERHRPLAGVIEAIGSFSRPQALPTLLAGLSEDFTRREAETAIRKLGPQAHTALFRVATNRPPKIEYEVESSRRRRLSALGLLAEAGIPTRTIWRPLRPLMQDEDARIATLACKICLASAPESERLGAIHRLITLLPSTDWLLGEEIEDCLSENFDIARELIEQEIETIVSRATGDSQLDSRIRALSRVKARGLSGATKYARLFVMDGMNKRKEQESDSDYRIGVGVMLLNNQGRVFVGRRIDTLSETWQMPQGGVENGEAPRPAAFRELKEETGISKAVVIAESETWLRYDLPSEIATATWDGRYCGQRQKWFLMRFIGRDTEIALESEHPEFDAWKWVPIDQLPMIVVSFKRQLYFDVLTEFRDACTDPG